MLKKTVTYTDFDGNQRTEDHYFNLTKAEVMMWLTTNGDYTLDKMIAQLTKEHDGRRIMELFEDLILRSYGEKSLDGRKFVKTDEIRENFKSTEAYSQIFMEVVTDAEKAADFVRSIIPSDLEAELSKVIKENPEGIPDELKDYLEETKRRPISNVIPTQPPLNLLGTS